MAFLLQLLLLAARLSEVATHMPFGGVYLQQMLPDLMLEVLLFSFGILMPVTVAVGVLVTFRIAGPVYRFEQYLESIARGEEVGPCKLRKGDELTELCDRINQASVYLQAARAEQAERESSREAA